MINKGMSAFKTGRIGVYGEKDRLLQRRLSFEKTTLTHHTVTVFKYLGDTNLNEGSSIFDISDSIFMENRDRRYDSNGVVINADVVQMEESPYDLSGFGIINPLEGQQIIRVHINSFESDGLSRYIITGDVIEIPFFSDKNGNNMFFEVTNVDEKKVFESFYVTVTLEPIKDTQEMVEIEGITSNSDVLADLQADLDAAYDATFLEEGLNTEPTLYVDRDYVEDDYVNLPPTTGGFTDDEPRDDYDPRPNSDFLDDPTRQVF